MSMHAAIQTFAAVHFCPVRRFANSDLMRAPVPMCVPVLPFQSCPNFHETVLHCLYFVLRPAAPLPSGFPQSFLLFHSDRLFDRIRLLQFQSRGADTDTQPRTKAPFAVLSSHSAFPFSQNARTAKVLYKKLQTFQPAAFLFHSDSIQRPISQSYIS